MAPNGPRRAGFALWLAALALAAPPAGAADASLFDEGRAQRAFAAIESKVGHKLRVTDLRLAPNTLVIDVASGGAAGEIESWQVSQKGSARAGGLDHATRLPAGSAATLTESVKESLFDLDADALAAAHALAVEALSRARLRTPGKVTEMELRRLPKALSAGRRNPVWLIRVQSVDEEVDLAAKLSGEILSADLGGAERGQNPDGKGASPRAKDPTGESPQVHLLQPAELQKALGTIAERLGPHAQIVKLLIGDDSMRIEAADPHAAGKLAAFAYVDGDVERESSVAQKVVDGLGAGPDWRWDLALLDAAAVQRIGALEQRTIQAKANAQVDRIEISKDKPFHPSNDRVLIDIHTEIPGQREGDFATYELSGAIARLDAPRSNLSASAANGEPRPPEADPSSDTDEEGCTRSVDPAVILAACTHMIAHSADESPHNRAVLFYDRGNAYKNLKQFDRAFADYSDALKLDPNYGHAYVNRAYVDAARGDAALALADGTKAIALDPNDAMAYFNRGLVYQAQKNRDAAIADFSRTIALDSDDSQPFFNRGSISYDKGDLDRAIADFSEAIKRSPRSAGAYNGRGLADIHKGDANRAIADFTQAIQIDGKAWGPYFNRGAAYYLAGALPKSLADLTEANALAPTQPYVALLLDIVAKRSGLASPLKDAAAKIDMTVWPAPLIRLYTGQLTPEATLAAADDADPEIKRGRICEADFYAGALRARAGRKSDAQRLFTLAARDCPSAYFEKAFAEANAKTLRAAMADER